MNSLLFSPSNLEEIEEGNSLDSSVQQVVGSGGQRVITIVTDGVPLGNIQTSIPAGSIGQPFIVTMQDGQQGKLYPVDKCLFKGVLDMPYSLKNEVVRWVAGVGERLENDRRISKKKHHQAIQANLISLTDP